MASDVTYSIFKVFICCYIVLTSCSTIFTWDIAITIDSHIEFYNNNGSRAGIASQSFTKLGPLSYDPVYHKMYFSNMQHTNATLYGFHLIGNKDFEHLVQKNFGDMILSIDVDPVSRILVWTEAKSDDIYWLSLAPGAENFGEGKPLINTVNQKPTGIAVDKCRSLIFWTNTNLSHPTIERATITGSDRRVIIDSSITNPSSIVVDEISKRIYWIDLVDLGRFEIKSANYDGSNHTTLYKGRNQRPYDLALGDDSLLWTDVVHNTVWHLSLDDGKLEPEKVLNDFSSVPMGIITNVDLLQKIEGIEECKLLKETILNATSQLRDYSYECHSENNVISNIQLPRSSFTYCLNGGKLESNKDMNDKCLCLKGYTGARCEISLCHNYCVNGTCILDVNGFPQCRCDYGFSGERCQRDMCVGYCLNNGTCSVQESKISCQCLSEWIGERCQVQKQVVVNNTKSAILNNGTTSENNEQSNNITQSILESLNDNTTSENEDLSNITTDIIKPVTLENNETSSNTTSNQNEYYQTRTNSELFLSNTPKMTEKCLVSDISDPIMIVIIALYVILAFIIVILTIKIFSLKKRPRIRKRIIVNKNVTPLQYRPNPPHCEITIENCCNMNICETPCFEPEGIRTVVDVSNKEEKKNLLLNMEHPDNLY